jgi:hypothetical protein
MILYLPEDIQKLYLKKIVIISKSKNQELMREAFGRGIHNVFLNVRNNT